MRTQGQAPVGAARRPAFSVPTDDAGLGGKAAGAGTPASAWKASAKLLPDPGAAEKIPKLGHVPSSTVPEAPRRIREGASPWTRLQEADWARGRPQPPPHPALPSPAWAQRGFGVTVQPLRPRAESAES